MTDQEVIDRARAKFEAEDAQQAVYDLQGKQQMELDAVDADAKVQKKAIDDDVVKQKQVIADSYKPQIGAVEKVEG